MMLKWNKCRKMYLDKICFVFAVLLIGCQIGQMNAQTIATYDVHLKDLLTMQKGLGWPHELLVAEGQEALMKLTATLPQPHSCVVTTPTGLTIDLASAPARYEHWSDGCGLRLRQVQMSDVGRWRLTATRDAESLVGWVELSVREDITSYTAPPIYLRDGETQTSVDLTSLDNAYCVVTQPFSQSSLVPGHCRVTLERTSRAVQGNWNVVVGMPGRISEIRADRQIGVEAERLDVGYVHDSNTNKLHLYCNILHSYKNITFCRFQKMTESLGYNVMEGLSDGTHSYYGNGFVAKECGMTIESPGADDYVTWRCSVGSQLWVDTIVQQQTPMQALINVIQNHRSSRKSRDASASEERTVFVQEDKSFTVMCQSELSLSYCWFLHPNGTQFSPVAHSDDNELFWYTGESLQTGDCGITFSHANISDAGDWLCHMGSSNHLGVEQVDRVNVRVTGPLAANKKELDIVVGQNVTLHCHTADGNRPLDYCRFLTPNYVGINIDSSITREKAILDRFFFPSQYSLDYGDCALVIISAQPEDVGTWTCAALINNDILEASDTVKLYINTSTGLSHAGVVGMSVGLVSLAVILVGTVLWYKFGKPIPWRRNRTESETPGFDVMSTSTSVRLSIENRSNDNSSLSSEEAAPTGKEYMVQFTTSQDQRGVAQAELVAVPGTS